jgi:hypothetical protein
VLFLIPHEVTSTSLTLWVAAVDEGSSLDALSLVPQLSGAQPPRNVGQWPTNTPQPRVRHHEIVVTGLSPRQTYGFSLMRGAFAAAHARVTTLPLDLPLEGDGRFTAFLGSCFSRLEDPHGRVARTFGEVPEPDRPHVKFFAGDQVYLDSPYEFFLARGHSVEVLREKFLEHYTETWSKGLADLLADGANFFCSDDHEFWNNAPNTAPHLYDTLPFLGHPREWWNAARELYCAFQNARPIQRFEVPPLSFLIADTRMNRSPRETEFMLESDLDAVEDWIEALDGPGVLVLGQPLLQTTTGFFRGHLFDWNLPDYAQYQKLMRIIGACRYSLVILTGDVHYGRIASSPLRSGAELIEIISSPMSLVDPKAKGNWESVPARVAPAALAPTGLFTKPDFTPNDSHFLTLEFTRRGVGANLKLRYWPIIQGQTAGPDFGRYIWERALV